MARVSKEYVYILTNPSMDGLVKIGKTTTTPSQRMSELHSTGVPTPFQLEFSVAVGDCHSAEKEVHGALSYCRISSNREFFKISPKEAIKKVLEVIDEFEIVDFRDTHGVGEIETEVRRRRQAKEEEARRRTAEREREKERQRQILAAARQKKRAELKISLRILEDRLAALGEKPTFKEPETWALLRFCYFPIPIGWVFWIGAFQIFNPKSQDVGLFFLILLGAGFWVNQHLSDSEEKNKLLIKPFNDIEWEKRKVEKELDELGDEDQSGKYKTNQTSSFRAQRPKEPIAVDSRGFEKPARKIGRR